MKSRYAMVSTDIRRDLLEPLRYFERLQITHLYRHSSYHDLAPEDLPANLSHYRSPLDLFRLLRRLRPDVIQGVDPLSLSLLPYSWAVLAAARLRRAPLVLATFENRPLSAKYGSVRAAVLRLALRPILRYARVILPQNEGAARTILTIHNDPSRLHRVMYGTWGVDPDEFTPQQDGREPDWGAGPVLLYVGRLHAEKGVLVLLEAFAAVVSAAPDTRLVLVGDGPARLEMEAAVAKRGWERRVQITGVVPNRELPPYFRAAQVFVAPSLTTRKWEEQVGMSNIQAMACGVPVVSTRSGAIPEYVPDGKAGILVPQGDPQALAQAILRLLRDDCLRREMGENGRQVALARYTAAHNVQRAESLILQACGREE